MKIGDEVYIHGYVDEIRKDVIIIRNDGGYFGTIEDEIISVEIKALHKDEGEPYCLIIDERHKAHCLNCAESGSYKCKKCDGEMYYKDTPQTDCDDRYAIRTDSGEVVAYACPLGCEQTDCGWGEPK